MHQVLETYRECEDDDVQVEVHDEEATFDFDAAEQKVAQKLRSKERQERRADIGLQQHKTTTAFFNKRRKANSALSTQVEKQVDIVTDISEIDDLDRGKTWKQLDNFMKRKRLREYGEWYKIHNDCADAEEDIVQVLLQKFREGKYRKTNELTYDAELGRITAIPDSN